MLFFISLCPAVGLHRHSNEITVSLCVHQSKSNQLILLEMKKKYHGNQKRTKHASQQQRNFAFHKATRCNDRFIQWRFDLLLILFLFVCRMRVVDLQLKLCFYAIQKKIRCESYARNVGNSAFNTCITFFRFSISSCPSPAKNERANAFLTWFRM